MPVDYCYRFDLANTLNSKSNLFTGWDVQIQRAIILRLGCANSKSNYSQVGMCKFKEQLFTGWDVQIQRAIIYRLGCANPKSNYLQVEM